MNHFNATFYRDITVRNILIYYAQNAIFKIFFSKFPQD